MKPTITLLGLEHLIAACEAHRLPLRMKPPLNPTTISQTSLLNQPLDPILSATLSRLNGGRLAELGLDSLDDTIDGLEQLNARMRIDAEERLHQIHNYGSFWNFAYYLATAPGLADVNGIQPVMYINMSEGVELLPIASSVDMAFESYARYLELLAERYGSVEAGREEMELFFPRSVPELIAKDARLVQMLERNRFEFFVARDKRSTDWVARVLHAAPRLVHL